MADASFEERTEAPTQRRRDEARRKGQVPKSTELTAAFLLLASAVALNTGGEGLARMFAEIFVSSTALGPQAGPGDLVEFLRSLGWKVLAALAPVVLVLAAVGGAVAAAQARGVWSTEALAPDFSRIAPHKNLGRLVSMRAVVDLVKSLLKLAVVGGVLYVALTGAWPELVSLSERSPAALLFAMRDHAVHLLMTAGLAFLGLAGADYAWQVWQHERQLRMTKDEVKREMKESEGDPLLKQRMRSAGRALVRRRMFRDVPSADVVVTNPTHIAVALKYDPEVSPAPIVLAMGERKVAERIKAIAHESGVPVLENKPLARALLATARVGLPIPVELYVAVAEVLAFVIRQRKARGPDWARSAFA
ncbi:MAG TPA: flagellar biosynthesis protein FlhB [Longimicrobiales bacterium]|nr:flagellar biosynthesis protein FlhB [Longimicrobiales bacterium]